MRERILIEAEICVKNGKWVEVLACCQRYRGQNQLIAYFTNMSLFHLGKMPYDLFRYPQPMGVESLYLPWKSDSRQSGYGHYLYEQLGYINEAHRWAFESMVVSGETAPTLINLIRYNIINGRPAVAMRFIRVLKQSLFYRKQAAGYEKIVYGGCVPGLKALKYIPEEKIRFANVLNIGPELRYLCERDSTNKMAFEYLMSNLLLGNQVVRWAENLFRIKAFSYPGMPRLYDEALLIYRLGVDDATFARLGFSVGRETEERFKDYYALYKKGDGSQLKKRFGDTYWYYLHFLSPYGNKIITN